MADPRLDTSSPTANERLFDAALRHQVGLRRFASGEVSRVNDLLEQADADLVRKLRDRLGSVRNQPIDFTSARWRALRDDIRSARREAVALMRGQLSPTLRQLSKMEAEFEARMIQASMPISINLATVEAATLTSIVTTQPFHGRLLGDWYQGLAQADQGRLLQQIRLGLTQGETLDEIVRRVAGTRRNRFADGVLSVTRRNAETVVRTAVNGVSNAARGAVWEANSDIISALRWTATLDGRTSAICRARDGMLAPATQGGSIPEGGRALEPSGARPPAHPNCRSIMVAVIDGVEAVGTRPTVRDTRTRGRREVDFRAEARRSGRPTRDVRKEWADKNIGSVPADVTYEEWLRRQSAGFQQDVLGKSRATLFRRGDVRLDQFVDFSGRQFTLRELRRSRPGAFDDAGL